MEPTLALSSNRTIVRFSLSQLMLRAYFATTSRLLPALARGHAERLFTAPPRHPGQPSPRLVARRDSVAVGAHELAVWHSGPAAAPAVLLVHGWGGAGAQMAGFVPPLLAAGYRVVWFDLPGHGHSGSGPVGLPDIERALHALAQTHGPFAGAIGHSLGAAALTLALRHGFELDRVVLIASPASMREHAHGFARRLGITPRVREAMRKMIERRYDVAFDEIDRIEDLARLRLPALFIHDAGDRQVPFEHARRLAGHMPGAHLLRTYGLGHSRLLRDRAVLRIGVDFVAGRAKRLPQELPELPLPAPLY